jgi:NodT family efflux transporter outer membrane factor (OMF) lipoprotein
MSRARTSLARRGLRAAGLTLSATLAGCMVGPNYERPSAPMTPAFKEAAGWRPSDPADGIDKGAWWSMFNDPALDSLERRVATSNQTVAQYEAAYRGAHAIVAAARATLFPTVSGALDVQRSGGAGAAASAGGATVATAPAKTAATGADGLLEASWVPDLWGKIRRTVESDRSLAQASAADLANARLSAQASLAEDYFLLRDLDEQARLYRETISGYEKYLQLTTLQFKEGAQPFSAVVSAQSQLYSAQALLVGLGSTRAQMEHAIAVLAGAPPADLSIAPAPLSRDVPVVPAGVPSTLLQRRPDIAAAERRVSSANAQIGVAIAAYFPDLTLSGQNGASGANLAGLFSAGAGFWSVGADLSATLLDFGQRRAQVAAARALHDEDVASYRQTVLTAFEGVEDQLANLRVFQQQEAVLLQNEAAANEAARLALAEYRDGVVDYTTVITAQAAALSASQNVLSVLAERYQASVLLVEDLGGGWSASDLPKN